MIMDKERLETIFGDDAPALRHFIETFTHDTNALLNDIAQDIKNRDETLGKQHCHRLKGSCGNAGAMDMHDLAKNLEGKVLQKEWADAETLYTSLQKAFKEVEQFLQKL